MCIVTRVLRRTHVLQVVRNVPKRLKSERPIFVALDCCGFGDGFIKEVARIHVGEVIDARVAAGSSVAGERPVKRTGAWYHKAEAQAATGIRRVVEERERFLVGCFRILEASTVAKELCDGEFATRGLYDRGVLYSTARGGQLVFTKRATR